MGKLVAVQGCSIKYSVEGGSCSIVGTIRPGNATISVKGNKAYKEKLIIDVVSGVCSLDTPPAGASSGSGVLSLGGTIEISGTSENSTTNGAPLVLKGDEGSQSFTFMFPPSSSPNPIPSNVKVTATVDDPNNQNVVNVT